MRILLDTHTFLWFIQDNPRLSAHSQKLIQDSSNEALLSIASIWEIAIKISIGKLSLNATFDEIFPSQLLTNDIQALPLAIEHLSLITTLPMHHRDPFDRLIIAQAIALNIPVISIDAAFDSYPVQREWE